MEVREAAACGVAEREFSIDFMEHEIVPFFKFLVKATEMVKDAGDPDLVEDMLVQIRQIVGPAVEE
ncbi:MAG: hypothetical protein NTW86_26085 [Candidatus Sumerlaeota bacterium]|nr:hypothetical protein [Candidatus Sumerlaeota bacterium]